MNKNLSQTLKIISFIKLLGSFLEIKQYKCLDIFVRISDWFIKLDNIFLLYQNNEKKSV